MIKCEMSYDMYNLRTPPSPAGEARKALTDFYASRDPAKLVQVDDLLNEFAGQESKILEMIKLAESPRGDVVREAKQKLITFYEQKDPSKLVRVDAMMEEFSGHEHKIIEMVKYADLVRQDKHEQQHFQSQLLLHHPPPRHEIIEQHEKYVKQNERQYLQQYSDFLQPSSSPPVEALSTAESELRALRLELERQQRERALGVVFRCVCRLRALAVSIAWQTWMIRVSHAAHADDTLRMVLLHYWERGQYPPLSLSFYQAYCVYCVYKCLYSILPQVGSSCSESISASDGTAVCWPKDGPCV